MKIIIRKKLQLLKDCWKALNLIADRIYEHQQELFRESERRRQRPALGTCDICVYSDIPEGDEHGPCRRRPPVTHIMPEGVSPVVTYDYPIVNPTDWCGEYR